MTQLDASLVKLGLGCADRATQIPGNLAVSQAFHVVQQEYCAIAGRKPPYGAADGDPVNGSRKLQILYWQQIQKRSFSRMLAARSEFNRNGAMTVGAQAHQYYVDGQTVQPG